MMKYLLLAFLYSTLTSSAAAQRFLRDGFSSTMDSEFQAEMGMDDTSAAIPGMTREMMGMQNVEWELTPPSSLANVISQNPQLAKHVQKYLHNQPISLKLTKRRGGTLGLRALGVTANGKKLRAFWRPAQSRPGQKTPTSTDFLTISYDEAVRSRLSGVEIEVQLPRFQKHVPSLVYHVSMESGLMNPKAVVTRGDGIVQMYPARDVKDAAKSDCVDVGTGKIGLKMKAGIVDPSWARGRSILRKGRSAGYV